MKRTVALSLSGLAICVVVVSPALISRVSPTIQPGWSKLEKRYTLPNGWRVTPAGKLIDLPGDMPGNIVLVDGGTKAIVNTCGFHDHSVNLVDLATGKLSQTVGVDRNWVGLAVDGSGRLFSSGGKVDDPGKHEAVHRLDYASGSLTRVGGFSLPGTAPKGQFVSGILVGKRGVYVLDVQHDRLNLVNSEGKLLARSNVGYRPYGLALSPDEKSIAVSEWGNQAVTLLDAESLEKQTTVRVSAQPTAVVYSADGRLFVANSGANTVSVIRGGRVTENVRTGVDRANRIGSIPVAMVLSPDSKTLYVANAGNNCVTVVDISNARESRVRGFIPTERYPSALAITPDGRKLLIATAKGLYGPNAGPGVSFDGPGVRGRDEKNPFIYIGNQLAGRLAIVDVPDRKALAAYSRQVVDNSPLGLRASVSPEERREIQSEAFDKIKHVIYVIKENRTYDQVLGDLPRGNGDPNLTIFGRKVTPNIHRLAEEFTLLDNLYADGETSQVGHQWADAAYAGHYTETQMIVNYSNRGEIESDTRLTSSPGEYLWTSARKKGLWARVYGEYVDVQEDHDSLNSEEIKKDPEKFGYSATFEKIFARDGRDTEKVDDFLREMREGEKTGKWPSLMVMALPEDHTHGFSAGRYSPYAMIGSNDLAVGKLVEAVSHSKFWKDTAIFVIQDDAQAGPDHVDSHRTVGLVVSPYVKRGTHDRTMYSTSSMLRTMELILGLPPMSQYDAAATPMFASFTSKADFRPYNASAPGVNLEERNPSKTALARRSAKLDFSDVDRADWTELNQILWEGYRPGVPYPAPVHGP